MHFYLFLTRLLQVNYVCELFKERTAQLRRECEDRRRREKQQDEAERQRLHDSAQWSSSDSAHSKHNQQEIESLRAVVEMRNYELNQLRTRNREIEKQVGSLRQLALLIRVSC